MLGRCATPHEVAEDQGPIRYWPGGSLEASADSSAATEATVEEPHSENLRSGEELLDSYERTYEAARTALRMTSTTASGWAIRPR
jgi:hypothetical protein